jgi:uncharacterized protein YbcV (DUF1398 family)
VDAQQIAIAERCLGAACAGTMSFPEIATTLLGAGFEGYLVDYRRDTTTYYLAGGDSVALESHPSGSRVAADFDPAGVAALIRWAQSGSADYSYAGFSRPAKARGCAGYVVSFPGRRVLYFGRDAQTHVEHFPSQPVRPAQAGSSS